jgi:hypothetical protein
VQRLLVLIERVSCSNNDEQDNLRSSAIILQAIVGQTRCMSGDAWLHQGISTSQISPFQLNIVSLRGVVVGWANGQTILMLVSRMAGKTYAPCDLSSNLIVVVYAVGLVCLIESNLSF